MADLTREFEQLVDPDMVVQFASIGGGYLVADLLNTVGEGTIDVLPDEAYGALAFVGLGMADDMVPYSAEMQMGAGAYAVHQLAERFGIVDGVRDVVGGGA